MEAFRALSGRLTFSVRPHNFNKEFPSHVGGNGPSRPLPHFLSRTNDLDSSSSSLSSLALRHPIVYRGTSLIRNSPPLRAAIGPQAFSYCRVLERHCFLRPRCPCVRRVTDPFQHDRHPQPLGDLYMGNSLIRNSAPLGPHSRTMPSVLWWP